MSGNKTKIPTAAQIEANRKNAKKSTGPTSEEGKAKVSTNAVTHGLTSHSLYNPKIDDEFEFKRFSDSVMQSLDPQGELEFFFANRVISCMWRLKRVCKIEEFLFSNEKLNEGECIADRIFIYLKDKIPIVNKYEKSIEKSLYQTLREYKKIKEQI